jgi:hypothetical protein
MKDQQISVTERFEILDLLARYNHLFDAGEAEAWADCFTPGGEFSGPAGEAKGTAALIAFCESSAKRFPTALHLTDHHLFEVRDEVVHHECVLSVQFASERGVDALLLRYQDELVRFGGRWRFRSRLVHPA